MFSRVDLHVLIYRNIFFLDEQWAWVNNPVLSYKKNNCSEKFNVYHLSAAEILTEELEIEWDTVK